MASQMGTAWPLPDRTAMTEDQLIDQITVLVIAVDLLATEDEMPASIRALVQQTAQRAAKRVVEQLNARQLAEA
jgi:hypothetical protein